MLDRLRHHRFQDVQHQTQGEDVEDRTLGHVHDHVIVDADDHAATVVQGGATEIGVIEVDLLIVVDLVVDAVAVAANRHVVVAATQLRMTTTSQPQLEAAAAASQLTEAMEVHQVAWLKGLRAGVVVAAVALAILQLMIVITEVCRLLMTSETLYRRQMELWTLTDVVLHAVLNILHCYYGTLAVTVWELNCDVTLPLKL